jgi:hypothetical protein
VLPFGGGVNILLLAGGAYFAWEHEKGRHEKMNLLCPICLLNRVAPRADASGTANSAPPSSSPPPPETA